MNDIKQIILIRHGETTKDKTDTNRGLTNRGKNDLIIATQKLKKYLRNRSVIVSTNNKRAIQSAELLAQFLKIPFRKDFCPMIDSYIIKNWDPLKKIQKNDIAYKNKDLTEIYFDLYEDNALPIGVPFPQSVASKFLDVIVNLDITADCLIIVTNGGSLEAAAFYQSFYVPTNGDKMYRKPIQYSQFKILTKQ